jgi:mono/diheme cytochrome c family protein
MSNAVMRIQIRVAFASIVAGCVLANAAAFAASAENGKIAFVKHGCWQCHGFLGQGSIATSNGKVLGPSALTFEIFANFVRSSNRTMPPYREAILSNGDLADIYAYLQSVPKPPDVNSIPLLKQ